MLLTLEYTIVLFGCIGIAGLVYLYFYLPETENKTLLEIEEFFATNSRIHQESVSIHETDSCERS